MEKIQTSEQQNLFVWLICDMAEIVKITGINTVIRNLTKAKKNIAAGVGRGLKKGGLHLQRKSQEIVPVDWGDLKGSSFCRNVGGTGFDTDIVVGYGSEACNYAVYVHEDLNKAHGAVFNAKYAEEIAGGKMTYKGKKKKPKANRGEKQQAKFLERPAREERRIIIRIIQREAKR